MQEGAAGSGLKIRPAPRKLDLVFRECVMSINNETDITANLQIGPTTLGMVRIYIDGDGIDLPMDFDPEEAEEIAEEIRAAAAQARALADSKGKRRG